MTTTTDVSICHACALRTDRSPVGGPMTCHAYPGGVPDDIASGDVGHLRLRGDEAEPVVFELASGALFQAWYRQMRDRGFEVKHLGPGPHPSGSPQAVHAGAAAMAARARIDLDALEVDDWGDGPEVQTDAFGMSTTWDETEVSLYREARETGDDLGELEVTPDTPLRTIQPAVFREAVRRRVEDPTHGDTSPPELIRDREGNLWVEQGHHRLAAARVRDEAITARVSGVAPSPKARTPGEGIAGLELPPDEMAAPDIGKPRPGKRGPKARRVLAAEPWNASAADLEAGRVPGIRVDPEISAHLAGHNRDPDDVVVSPSFLTDSPAERFGLVAHEVGHDVAATAFADANGDLEHPVWQALARYTDDDPITVRSRFDNPFGLSDRPEEMVADAYAELLTFGHDDDGEGRDPEGRNAQLLGVVAEYAARLGLPTDRIENRPRHGSPDEMAAPDIGKPRPGKRAKPEAAPEFMQTYRLASDLSWLGEYEPHFKIGDKQRSELARRLVTGYETGSVTGMKRELERAQADGVIEMDRSSTTFAYAWTHRIDDLLGHAAPEPDVTPGWTLEDGEHVLRDADGRIVGRIKPHGGGDGGWAVYVLDDKGEFNAQLRGGDLDKLKLDVERRAPAPRPKPRPEPTPKAVQIEEVGADRGSGRVFRVRENPELRGYLTSLGHASIQAHPDPHDVRVSLEDWKARARWRLDLQRDNGELNAGDYATQRYQIDQLTRFTPEMRSELMEPDDPRFIRLEGPDEAWMRTQLTAYANKYAGRTWFRDTRWEVDDDTGAASLRLERAYGGPLEAARIVRTQSGSWDLRLDEIAAKVTRVASGFGGYYHVINDTRGDRDDTIRYAELLLGLTPVTSNPDADETWLKSAQGDVTRFVDAADGTRYALQSYAGALNAEGDERGRVVVRVIAPGERIGSAPTLVELAYGPVFNDHSVDTEAGRGRDEARALLATFAEYHAARYHGGVVTPKEVVPDVVDDAVVTRMRALLDPRDFRIRLPKNTSKATLDDLARIAAEHRGNSFALQRAVIGLAERGRLRTLRDSPPSRVADQIHAVLDDDPGAQITAPELERARTVIAATRLRGGFKGMRVAMQDDTRMARDLLRNGNDPEVTLRGWMSVVSPGYDADEDVELMRAAMARTYPTLEATFTAALAADVFERASSHDIKQLQLVADDVDAIHDMITSTRFIKLREAYTPDVAAQLLRDAFSIFGGEETTPRLQWSGINDPHSAEIQSLFERAGELGLSPDASRASISRITGVELPRIAFAVYAAQRDGRSAGDIPDAFGPRMKSERTRRVTEETYTKLATDYPSLATTLKAIDDDYTSDAYAVYSSWKRTISLQAKRWGTDEMFERNERSLRNDSQSRFHPVGTDSLEGVLTHEFGHHIYYNLTADERKTLWTGLRRYLAEARAADMHAFAVEATPGERQRVVDSLGSTLSGEDDAPYLPQAHEALRTLTPDDAVKVGDALYLDTPAGYVRQRVTEIGEDGRLHLVTDNGELRDVTDAFGRVVSKGRPSVFVTHPSEGYAYTLKVERPDPSAVIDDLVNGRITPTSDFDPEAFWVLKEDGNDLVAGTQVTYGLARYALKNDNEFLAEAFSEWRMRGEAARPIAQIVGRFIDHHFKGI